MPGAAAVHSGTQRASAALPSPPLRTQVGGKGLSGGQHLGKGPAGGGIRGPLEGAQHAAGALEQPHGHVAHLRQVEGGRAQMKH